MKLPQEDCPQVPCPYIPTAGFGALDGVRVTEKTAGSVTLEFSVPPSNPYFDGHFPGFSILPAVAQLELVLRFAALHLGTGIDVSEMRRVKFTKFILPRTPLALRLEKGEKTISFKMFSPKNSPEAETVYSTGILAVSVPGFSASGIDAPGVGG